MRLGKNLAHRPLDLLSQRRVLGVQRLERAGLCRHLARPKSSNKGDQVDSLVLHEMVDAGQEVLVMESMRAKKATLPLGARKTPQHTHLVLETVLGVPFPKRKLRQHLTAFSLM